MERSNPKCRGKTYSITWSTSYLAVVLVMKLLATDDIRFFLENGKPTTSDATQINFFFCDKMQPKLTIPSNCSILVLLWSRRCGLTRLETEEARHAQAQYVKQSKLKRPKSFWLLIFELAETLVDYDSAIPVPKCVLNNAKHQWSRPAEAWPAYNILDMWLEAWGSSPVECIGDSVVWFLMVYDNQ